jgi:ribosomal protein S18 acetylase RimI-like enzyme
MTADLTIRRLTDADTEAYSELRLRALRDHPEAFGASPASHPDLASIRRRFLNAWDGRSTVALGAFRDGTLVGLCVLQRPDTPKSRHKGHLFQMYVALEERDGGIGRRLLDVAIDRARRWGLSHLQLAVTTDNAPAIGLYQRAGFRIWGVEPEGLRIGDVGHDFAWMVLEL